ncbi:MAG: DUF58 domain-containing protein [Pirellulales bacterium]|nr:DUF58 domain-containing protein [Pirellulales bacterium]
MSPFAIVLLELAAVAAPLWLLGRYARVFPRRRLVLAALAPSAVTFGLLATDWFLPAVVLVDVALVVLAVGDLATLPRARHFSVERQAVRVASLRKPHPVSLTVDNLARRAWNVSVRDGVPRLLSPSPEQFDVSLPRRRRTVLHYELRAGRRGAFSIENVYLRARSHFGLWQRSLSYPLSSVIHVYPDMKQLGQYAALARTNRLSLVGVRRVRRIGQDHEFERLRDYRVDDNYRFIDWRATARRRKLTVKDFQSSQAQRIVFLLDCGRMMTNEARGLSLLDHGLNAMLMLAYVALRQGDSVGLIAFADRVLSHIPARGGMNQMNRLLHAGFDRFPTLVESRYDLAFHYLAAHCRRRALVVLVTNAIDEVNTNQIEQYLANLVGRHLPLGVLLRDRRLFEAVEPERLQGDALWRGAAAAEILTWRQQVLTDLASKGVLVLDVFPDQMTAPLVNRYLEIKARHLL